MGKWSTYKWRGGAGGIAAAPAGPSVLLEQAGPGAAVDGVSATFQRRAWRFFPTAAWSVTRADLSCQQTIGGGTGVNVELWNDTSNLPGSILGTTNTRAFADVPVSCALLQFDFSPAINLSFATPYWLALHSVGSAGVAWCSVGGTPPANSRATFVTGVWVATPNGLYVFRLLGTAS